MKNNYSEKEITIFNGVLRLAEGGADISKITARQIAASAGVGKATIYDYFSSKEEIVKGALLYSMSMEADRFAAAMAATPDFAQKMHTIYDGIISTVENTGSIFNMMLNRDVKPSLDKTQQAEISPRLKNLIMEFVQILYGVLSRGYQQKVIAMDINDPLQRDYVHMVLFSNIFATGHRAGNKYCSIPRETIIHNAYTMLVKALN